MKHVKTFEGFFGRLFGTDLFTNLSKMSTSSEGDGISVMKKDGEQKAEFDGQWFGEEDIVIEKEDNYKNKGFESQFGKLPRTERIEGKLKLVVPGGDLYDRWIEARRKDGWKVG